MNNKGFTLIETMIAIFLLTLTIGGLLTLAAGGYTSVRYSRNQIVANSLVQESLEWFRNSRDSHFQQAPDWTGWVANFTTGGPDGKGCFGSTGCDVDPYALSGNPISACASSGCPNTYYFAGSGTVPGFYGYLNDVYPQSVQSTPPVPTTYQRTITMKYGTTTNGSQDPNQLIITATITWMNGVNSITTSQSILLTNWHT